MGKNRTMAAKEYRDQQRKARWNRYGRFMDDVVEQWLRNRLAAREAAESAARKAAAQNPQSARTASAGQEPTLVTQCR